MSSSGKAKDDLDAAIRQLVSQSIVPIASLTSHSRQEAI
jgi:hypothetical protein